MKSLFILFLLFFYSSIIAEDESIKIVEKEFAIYLKLIKDGKIDETTSTTTLSEKEIDEIFNDKAPKSKIFEFLTKIKEYQNGLKEQITKEISPKMAGTKELIIEPKKLETSEVHPWLKENINIYRIYVKYPDGTSGGTSTAIVFNNKFKFIRHFDSLPEGIKKFEENFKK